MGGYTAEVLGDRPNLLVLLTVSKMGLAGLRLGYLAGPPVWLQEIDKTRLPYNINVLTQVTAAFALRRKAVPDTQTQSIRAERGRLINSTHDHPRRPPFPNDANFILRRLPAGRADAVFAGLERRRVLVENLNAADHMLHNCLRVTAGLPQENQVFLAALRAECRAGDAPTRPTRYTVSMRHEGLPP